MNIHFRLVSVLGPWIRIVVAAVALTLAGLLWLHQNSVLDATGRRIFEMEAQRQVLLERRAALLVAHAAATDPRHLDVRARQLGFGSAQDVEYVGIDLFADGTVRTFAVAASSPLALTSPPLSPPPADKESPLTRLLARTARPAAAQGVEVAAVGSATQ